MSNYNVNEQEQKQAERIRRQYMNREDNKVEQLKKLDNKVKVPGKVVGTIIGVVGALVMGTGMSFVMVWENMTIGLILGIPGLIVAALAYPVYFWITSSRKKKYANEIMNLSEELIRK